MPVIITVAGILFDMDGTLIDSTPAVEETMRNWTKSQGIDFNEFIQHSHGVKTAENIKRWQTTPLGSSLSEEEVTASVFKLESLISVTGARLASEGGRGIEILPGVDSLLAQLRDLGARFGKLFSCAMLTIG
jgi:beta-phosphoglucomutase-like phosphatase (HAD superfamily)